MTPPLARHAQELWAASVLINPVDHLDNPDYAGGVWGVVEFDVTPYFGKSVRFNATLPEQLLERIDQRVERDQRYRSRSGFLAAAALRELSA